jgi:hypothetical protein
MLRIRSEMTSQFDIRQNNFVTWAQNLLVIEVSNYEHINADIFDDPWYNKITIDTIGNRKKVMEWV